MAVNNSTISLTIPVVITLTPEMQAKIVEQYNKRNQPQKIESLWTQFTKNLSFTQCMTYASYGFQLVNLYNLLKTYVPPMVDSVKKHPHLSMAAGVLAVGAIATNHFTSKEA